LTGVYIVTSKRTGAKDALRLEIEDEALTEAEIDRALAERRSEIEAMLSEARESIRRGDVAPLEQRPALLRAARRAAKTPR
jgi:hypothetical protein